MSSFPATTAIYEIKSADLPLVAFQLKSMDLQAVEQALSQQLAETPGFFDHDPALIDLDNLATDAGAIDFSRLINVLRQNQLNPGLSKRPMPNGLKPPKWQVFHRQTMHASDVRYPWRLHLPLQPLRRCLLPPP